MQQHLVPVPVPVVYHVIDTNGSVIDAHIWDDDGTIPALPDQYSAANFQYIKGNSDTYGTTYEYDYIIADMHTSLPGIKPAQGNLEYKQTTTKQTTGGSKIGYNYDIGSLKFTNRSYNYTPPPP